MVNNFCYNYHNILVTFLTVIIFSSATLTPQRLMAVNIDMFGIVFVTKVKKTYKKIQKCIEKKNADKLVDCMFDLKEAIEKHTGSEIHFGKLMRKAQEELETRGQNISTDHLNQLKKKFKKIEKKRKHKMWWFNRCVEAGIPYSEIDADLNFEMMCKAKSSHEDQEGEVPIKVEVSVTLALCGLFLICIPNEVCKQIGLIILGGIGYDLTNEGMTGWYRNHREEEKKNGRFITTFIVPPLENLQYT